MASFRWSPPRYRPTPHPPPQRTESRHRSAPCFDRPRVETKNIKARSWRERRKGQFHHPGGEASGSHACQSPEQRPPLNKDLPSKRLGGGRVKRVFTRLMTRGGGETKRISVFFFLFLSSFFPSMAFILGRSELSTCHRNRPRRTGHFRENESPGRKGAITTWGACACQKLKRTSFPECPVPGGFS